MHYFNPHHLFPSTPYTSDPSSSILLTGSSVALTGVLPISSLLHLALAHLRFGSGNPTSGNKDTKGKGRAVDEAVREAHVLILSPDRGRLQEALVDENEASLKAMRCDGASIKLLEKIEFKYLPTAAHLRYFLMTLYSYSTTSAATAHEAYIASAPASKGKISTNDPSYLEKLPTLVILHDLSLYLAEDESQKGGLEAYASLLALFKSTFAQLSPSAPPLLILHDRNATNTQIPVLPTHLRLPKTRKRSRNRMNGNNEEGEEEEEQDRESIDGGDVGERIQVERIMECFFDWTGKVGRAEFNGLYSYPHEISQFNLTMTESTREGSAYRLIGGQKETGQVEVGFSIEQLLDSDGGFMSRIEVIVPSSRVDSVI